MGVVGSSGWYAALGVAVNGAGEYRAAESAPFWLPPGGADTRIRGEHRGLAGDEQISERAPVEAFAPAPHQLHEARGGCLGICERVVRLAVHDTQLAAEPLESDRVLQVEELGGQPGGVDVVGVEARADGAPDQPGVERISTVLHQHGALSRNAETAQRQVTRVARR